MGQLTGGIDLGGRWPGGRLTGAGDRGALDRGGNWPYTEIYRPYAIFAADSVRQNKMSQLENCDIYVAQEHLHQISLFIQYVFIHNSV